MELSDIRKKIDVLDAQLIDVLAARMALIPEIARYKQQRGIQRKNEERERQVILHVRQHAQEKHVNPELAEHILTLIIADAHRIEREIMDA